MLERGIAAKDVEAVCYQNALAALARAARCTSRDWLAPMAVDQRKLFEGNSVLRGQTPRVGAVPESEQAAGALALK